LSAQQVPGEAGQIGVADAGEVGRGNARLGVCGAYGQLLAVQHFDDFGSQDGLELLDIGAGMAQVAENIAAAAHQFNLFVFHPSTSLSFFKRS